MALGLAAARTGFFAAALAFGFVTLTVDVRVGFADFFAADFADFDIEAGRFAALPLDAGRFAAFAFAAGFTLPAGDFALGEGLVARFVLAGDDAFFFLLFAIDPSFPSVLVRRPARFRGF